MKTTLKVIGIVLLAVAFLSFVSGMAEIGAERDPVIKEITGSDGICEYKSYASIYNPFYRAGCELFEVRN